MNRREAIGIGLFLGFMCPLSFVVLGWWSFAALSIYHVMPISDSGIARAALGGLGLGVLLDIVGLRSWVARFYVIDLKWLTPIYLFWSVMAAAFLMGLPFGVMALGVIGGLYMGRRMYHAGAAVETVLRSSRSTAVFSATVTGVEALFIGFLALQDKYTMTGLQEVLGLNQLGEAHLVGAGLVAAGCLILVLVQCWCTKAAAMLAFRVGGNAHR